MRKLMSIVTGSVMLVGLISGRHSPTNAAKLTQPQPVSRSDAPSAFEQQRERATYVDSHYQQILKSGRVANENEARVLAAHDFEAYERHRTDKNTQTVRWSSRDKAIREQKQFEKELSEMEQP